MIKPRILEMKVVLSDIDGTLLGSNHEMQMETISAIRLLMEAGYAFFPCTGRSRESMASAVGENFLKLFGNEIDVKKIPGVYQQGLQVYAPNGQLIYERLLPLPVIEKVETFCANNKISLIAYCGETIYTAKQTYYTEKVVEYKEPVPTLSNTVGALSLADLPRNGHSVHKLILLADDDDLERIRPLLATTIHGDASITKAVKGMLEVLPEGASKGVGVEALLKHLGTDPQNVISFGDGENDVEMISLCGMGVAVGNARPVLKSAAKLVLTKTNDEQAVAECLRELVSVSKDMCADEQAQEQGQGQGRRHQESLVP